MGKFNLEDYETVETRLVKFWEDHPNGRIETSIYHYDEKFVVMRAHVYFGDIADEVMIVKATGYAEEVRGAGPVNSTSHLENCETSAIGRALANCGYASKHRPSREEMEKVERGPQVPVGLNDLVIHTFPGSTIEESHQQASRRDGDDIQTVTPITPKQMALVRSMLRGLAMNDEEALDLASATVGRMLGSLGELDKGEGSAYITALKNAKNV